MPKRRCHIWHNYMEHIRVHDPENLDCLMNIYQDRENAKNFLYKLVEEIIIICQNIFHPNG